MNQILERMRTLTVADIMQRRVTTVSCHQPMGEAAAALVRSDVSDAPVVDEFGRCVGVLSARDFVRREAADGERVVAAHAAGMLGGECYSPAEREPDCVARFMNRAVQPVPASAAVLRAAQIMCCSHLHCLPVLDGSGTPVGIVTSLDIVAAVMQAGEEALS